MKVILDEQKIGEKLTVGVNAENDEIGLFIASEDVSASCAFRPEEWDNFVKAIKEAETKNKTKSRDYKIEDHLHKGTDKTIELFQELRDYITELGDDDNNEN